MTQYFKIIFVFAKNGSISYLLPCDKSSKI